LKDDIFLNKKNQTKTMVNNHLFIVNGKVKNPSILNQEGLYLGIEQTMWMFG